MNKIKSQLLDILDELCLKENRNHPNRVFIVKTIQLAISMIEDSNGD